MKGFGEVADDLTVDRDFDLTALVSGFLVDDGVRLTSFAVDVLGDISSIGMASVAELAVSLPHVVWIGALAAVGSMTGEGAHDGKLVIARGSHGAHCCCKAHAGRGGCCARHWDSWCSW